MTFLDKEHIIGNITPNVFISRIVLTSAGVFERITDPHIDHEREPGIVRDSRTGKLVFEKTTPNFQTKSNSSKQLNISISLILKEILDKGLIGRWFGDIDFSKYIKVRLIQTTEPSFFKTLRLATNMSFDDPVKIVEFSVSDIRQNIQNAFEEVLSDGTKIINFIFEANFQIKDVEPNYLAYLAFSYLDIQQIVNDFGLKSDIVDLLNPIGKAVSEIVFSEGKVVDKSFAYFTETGDVWVGPIAEVRNEFFGIRSNGQQIKIFRQQVSNFKIQDFRIFDVLQEINIDLNLENSILDKLQTIKRDPFTKEEPNSFFSEMSFARDKNDRNRFVFAVDFEKILRKNSLFGRLFDERSEIVRKSRIISLSVFRRRVKGSAELRTGADPTQKFMDDQSDEFILSTGEPFFGNITPVNDQKAAFSEIGPVVVEGQNLENVRFFSGIDKEIADATDGYFIYGIKMAITDPALEFTGEKLTELREIRGILEEYLAEASFGGSIVEDINLTNPHIDHPREILQKGDIVPSNFDPITNRFSQNFIETMKNRFSGSEIPPWSASVAKFIEIFDFFVDDIDFVSLEKQLLSIIHPVSGTLLGIEQLIKIITLFESKLCAEIGQTYIKSKIGEKDRASAVKSSIIFRDPSVGTISVSHVFQETVFNSSLGKGMGFDFLDIEENNPFGLKIVSGGEYETRVDRETNKYFNRLNGLEPNINLRARDEVFTDGDSIENTSWSYLSPAKINIGNFGAISRLGNSPQPPVSNTDLASANIAIKLFNSDKNAFGKFMKISSNQQKFVARSMDVGLSSVGASVLNKIARNPVGGPKVFSQERIPNIVDPIEQPFGECENNINDVAKAATIPLFLSLFSDASFDGSVFKVEQFSLDNFDLKSPNGGFKKLTSGAGIESAERFFQGASHSTTMNEALKALPNQIKSLFLSQTRSDIVRKNWFSIDRANPTRTLGIEEESEFKFDYLMLNVVQVFKGFVRDQDGKILIKRMLWEPLTLEKWNRSLGKSLICRLQPYENKIFGLARDRASTLPVYDQFFILIPKQIVDGVKQREIPKVEPPKFRTVGSFDVNLKVGIFNDLNVENQFLSNIRPDYLSTNFIDANEKVV